MFRGDAFRHDYILQETPTTETNAIEEWAFLSQELLGNLVPSMERRPLENVNTPETPSGESKNMLDSIQQRNHKDNYTIENRPLR
ncbi:hypothetical protein TNCV_2365631 [Trichonephila clavipes]|nr:hypothetical protein TNCV_2365631 [Trichonephila clavipes]